MSSNREFPALSLGNLTRTPSKFRALALAAALLPAGCDDGDGGGKTPDFSTRTIALHAFDSCDDLLAYFHAEANATLDAYGNLEYPVAVDDFARGGAEGEPSAAPQDGNAGGDGGGERHSGTNVQVAGVDEPDFVKTDGRYVYLARNGYFLIYDADLTELARVALEGGYDAQLLVDGDQAVVLSQQWGRPVPGLEAENPERQQRAPKVELRVFDITDRAAPALVRTVYVEGYLQAARLARRTVRVVAHFDPSFQLAGRIDFGGGSSGGGREPTPVDVDVPPSEGGGSSSSGADGNAGEAIEEPKADHAGEDHDWRAEVRRVIAESTLDDWMPLVYEVAGDRREVGRVAACTAFHRPGERAGFGIASVFSIDLDRPLERLNDPAVVTGPGVVYASADSLYLTTGNHFGFGVARGGDVAVGAPSDGVAGTGGTDAVDDAPVATRRDELRVEDERQATQLHKLDISDPDAGARYRLSGRVYGNPLNQFAIDEFQGAVRIATTETRMADWTDVNHLFVLREGQVDGEPALEITGQLTDLAEGERIYAVRFMEERGFLVTFRQVDPLFTIDLSDPTNPIKVGELKIPGFSTYLHPFGEDHLIGVGQAATEEGRVTGMKLSLFDVSDFANPLEAHQHELGEGWSEALYNHHAFTFWAPESLLMLPVNAWEGDMPHQGLDLFRVSAADGFVEAGHISHADLAEGHWAEMQRSLVIGDVVYSISTRGVKANDLDDLELRGQAVFPEPAGGGWDGGPDGGGRGEPTEPGVPEPLPDDRAPEPDEG